MAPKKGQKMSLNAFLEDSSLGSWADEMEALPTAPAPKVDDGLGRGNDREFARRDRDFTRSDRAPMPPREDVPLPTQPPYTAFVGNLPFDLTESELGSFFGPHELKSVKIIRDRDEKPKGFGYVEFADVEGLKDALNKSGATFSNRTIRVNVAEPQKERSGAFGGSDDDKFAGNWRREGPLPDLNPQGRDSSGSRRRFDGISPEPGRESLSDTNSDWRSNRPARFNAEPEPPRRKGSGFSTPTHEGEMSPADTEKKWTIGGKFKPSFSPDTESQSGSRFGSVRGRGEMGPPPPPSSVADESDWRKPRPARNNSSPSGSVPSTPQMSRRKLELLPRSTAPSTQPTPLSSPKSASHANLSSSAKSNPFGAARPVDVTAREAAALEKIEKEREEVHQRVAQHTMSRTTSRQARERPGHSNASGDSPRSPSMNTTTLASNGTTQDTPPTARPNSPRVPSVSVSSTVRPAFSFANAAAAGKKNANAHEPTASAPPAATETTPVNEEEVVEKLAQVSV